MAFVSLPKALCLLQEAGNTVEGKKGEVREGKSP